MALVVAKSKRAELQNKLTEFTALHYNCGHFFGAKSLNPNLNHPHEAVCRLFTA